MKRIILLLVATFVTSACIDSDNVKPDDLAGYVLVIEPLNHKISPVAVFAFAPGGIVKTFKGQKAYSFSDSVITFEENGTNRFALSDGQVTTWQKDGVTQRDYKFDLKKASAQSQLTGKHFIGTYYKADGTVLHTQFHYSFQSATNTFQAWLEDNMTNNPRAGFRTQPYQSFANLQAFHQFTSGTYQGDEEILSFIDGKLYVSYYDAKNKVRYGGIFDQFDDLDHLSSDPQDKPSCEARLPSVSFKAKSIRISSDNEAILSWVANTLLSDVTCKIVVTGYCNDWLEDRQRSWDRVFNVIEYLTKRGGIESSRLIFQYGKPGRDCGIVNLSVAGENRGGAGLIPPRP